MSTIYIRLPSRSAAESAARLLELECPFALVSDGGSIEREGASPLPDLKGIAAGAQRVVLLLAASDVTILHARVPPLTAARLKAALPNLVEDQLLADPGDCVMVAGGISDGLRTVAVVQRAWLELLAGAMIASGLNRFVALPAQLCLRCPDHQGQHRRVIAAIDVHGAGIELAMRFSEQDGVGLTIEHHEAALQTLRAIAPEAQITLYVPQTSLDFYREAINPHPIPPPEGEGAIDLSPSVGKMDRWPHIDVLADDWALWIAGAGDMKLDLMRGVAGNSGMDWHAWRWPLALAALVLLMNAAALNIDWWRMKEETSALRTAMIQTYRQAYPGDSVIIDPVAQMRQRIAVAKRGSGQPAPDDFIPMAASFGEAWAGAMPGQRTVSLLEYRERSLLVHLKPDLSGVKGHDGEAPSQQLKAALAERGLSLDLMPAQPGVWRIRISR